MSFKTCLALLPLRLAKTLESRCKTRQKQLVRRISLFFRAPYSDAPIDGTGNGESTPNAPRLLQTHRERRRQDLGQWRVLPWRERTEATGG